MKIPTNWHSVLLHGVADVRSGLSKSSNRGGQSVKKPYMRVANVQDGFIDLSEVQEIDVPINQVARFTLMQGDILLIEGNGNPENLGRGCIWRGEIPECVHQNHVFAVRKLKNAEILPDFLMLQLQSRRGRNYLLSCAKSSTGLSTLNAGQLNQFPVHLPPLNEQQKITEILRTWDEAIGKLNALREAKQKRHRALTHSLVFGTRQLDRFRTTDEVTPHRWFTLPASWGSKAIGKLAREISERNGDANPHEVLSCSKHEGFVRSLEYFKKQVFSADLSGYKRIWRGDFGFPSNHVEEGSIGLQNLTDIGLVSPIYTVFRFAPEEVDADYAFAVLKTGLYRHIFEVSTSASVDRRGSLRWSEFSKLPFPVPSLPEQKAITEVLRTAKADLDALTTEIEALARQKRGLMQKLLTGEWRVNELSEEGTA